MNQEDTLRGKQKSNYSRIVTIIDWMNASWDFRQKINPYEEGIMKTTSTRSLEQFVLRSAANGLLAKAYMVK